jgi:hypothetical protein
MSHLDVDEKNNEGKGSNLAPLGYKWDFNS